jgi:hypothetical protein
VIRAAVTREHAARRLVVANERSAEAVLASLAASSAPAAPERVAAAANAPATAPVPTAPPPTPVPTATPAATPAAVAQHDEGVGNFGETYPASVEPSVRGAMLSGLAGVVVRVSVDENGRATAVDFVREPGDPSQRDELRARILAARFIPAACNGLRCAGTVVLRT